MCKCVNLVRENAKKSAEESDVVETSADFVVVGQSRRRMHGCGGVDYFLIPSSFLAMRAR